MVALSEIFYIYSQTRTDVPIGQRAIIGESLPLEWANNYTAAATANSSSLVFTQAGHHALQDLQATNTALYDNIAQNMTQGLAVLAMYLFIGLINSSVNSAGFQTIISDIQALFDHGHKMAEKLSAAKGSLTAVVKKSSKALVVSTSSSSIQPIKPTIDIALVTNTETNKVVYILRNNATQQMFAVDNALQHGLQHLKAVKLDESFLQTFLGSRGNTTTSLKCVVMSMTNLPQAPLALNGPSAAALNGPLAAPPQMKKMVQELLEIFLPNNSASATVLERNISNLQASLMNISSANFSEMASKVLASRTNGVFRPAINQPEAVLAPVNKALGMNVTPVSLAPVSLAPASLAPASLAPASLAPASLAPEFKKVLRKDLQDKLNPDFAAPLRNFIENNGTRIDADNSTLTDKVVKELVKKMVKNEVIDKSKWVLNNLDPWRVAILSAVGIFTAALAKRKQRVEARVVGPAAARVVDPVEPVEARVVAPAVGPVEVAETDEEEEEEEEEEESEEEEEEEEAPAAIFPPPSLPHGPQGPQVTMVKNLADSTTATLTVDAGPPLQLHVYDVIKIIFPRGGSQHVFKIKTFITNRGIECDQWSNETRAFNAGKHTLLIKENKFPVNYQTLPDWSTLELVERPVLSFNAGDTITVRKTWPEVNGDFVFKIGDKIKFTPANLMSAIFNIDNIEPIAGDGIDPEHDVAIKYTLHTTNRKGTFLSSYNNALKEQVNVAEVTRPPATVPDWNSVVMFLKAPPVVAPAALEAPPVQGRAAPDPVRPDAPPFQRREAPVVPPGVVRGINPNRNRSGQLPVPRYPNVVANPVKKYPRPLSALLNPPQGGPVSNIAPPHVAPAHVEPAHVEPAHDVAPVLLGPFGRIVDCAAPAALGGKKTTRNKKKTTRAKKKTTRNKKKTTRGKKKITRRQRRRRCGPGRPGQGATRRRMYYK